MTPNQSGLIVLVCVLGTGIYGLYDVGAFEAQAHIPTDETRRGYESSQLYHLAEHMLEEEMKQTALLDHIDCLIFYQDHSIPFHGYQGCGSPLNMTGVYHP